MEPNKPVVVGEWKNISDRVRVHDLTEQLRQILKIIGDCADCDERGNRMLVDHILWRIKEEVLDREETD